MPEYFCKYDNLQEAKTIELAFQKHTYLSLEEATTRIVFNVFSKKEETYFPCLFESTYTSQVQTRTDFHGSIEIMQHQTMFC